MTIYQLYCDNYLLDDIRTDDYIVASPKVTFKKNKVGGLTFTIYKTHPYYDKIKIKRSIIELRKNDKAIFRGRASEYTQEFNLSKNVDVEDILSFFNDSIHEPFDFHGSPVELFTDVINNHNAQVAEWQRFKIGQVDNLDSNDYIYRSSVNYLTSWEIIESRLLNIGGLLRVRYENDGNYIDWIEGTQNQLNTSTQIVEYGENIVGLKKTNSATETYSAILPLGAVIENNDESTDENVEDNSDEDETTETEERITIEALPDEETGDIVKKGKWLYSKSAVEKYGWVAAPISKTTWELKLEKNLLKKAKEYLTNTGILISNTLEINAADLSLTDDEINSFNFLDYIRIKSTIHGIDNTFLLSELELPYKDPQNTKITVGETKLSLVDEQLGNKNQILENVNRIDNAFSQIALNQGKINSVIQEQVSYFTQMIQNSEGIVMEAVKNYVKTSDYEEFKESIGTKLTQTAEGFDFDFQEFKETVKNDNDNIYAILEEYQKYIRFIKGAIELGEAENPLTTKIENGQFSFLVNGEVTNYFSNGKSYNEEVEVEQRLTIGNFAWVNRSDGSLELKKIK